jgi:hypothetical protein
MSFQYIERVQQTQHLQTYTTAVWLKMSVAQFLQTNTIQPDACQ